MTKVKICGLNDPASVTAAIEGGADFLGFVFYPPSPRAISPETASYLSSYVPDHIKTVGLFVDPTDADLQVMLDQVPLSYLQLHGAETPTRVEELKEKFHLPVIKAIGLQKPTHLEKAALYTSFCDWLLFDAPAAALPGGNGDVFDWSLLAQADAVRPFMLAGGLNPDNVIEAIAQVRPNAVDVSSGVESAPGKKDPDKIRAFLRAVKQA
jgi:phosphoribosylanthranilate isomerase